MKQFQRMPDYLGTAEQVATQAEDGKVFATVNGDLVEVVKVHAALSSPVSGPFVSRPLCPSVDLRSAPSSRCPQTHIQHNAHVSRTDLTPPLSSSCSSCPGGRGGVGETAVLGPGRGLLRRGDGRDGRGRGVGRDRRGLLRRHLALVHAHPQPAPVVPARRHAGRNGRLGSSQGEGNAVGGCYY